ncbi:MULTISPECIES: tyrosine--tRNA ligase [Bacillus cereus group]|uniref:tyrosine--tRNA ligase n=1 Tax=Bacillus cereus group TaxID=86661 RepID=UPI0025A4D5AB|nr:tyrosine--tRNA ligase [Bacillus thuringiensis]MDM8365448.1 tyrosine--tRNA ligase [Bacillus thuringiensis]
MNIEELLNDFSRTTEEVFSLEELKSLLHEKKKLNIKYGVDVTAPYLHLGHAVNLWMLRKLQDLGHKVQFLIGDFTTTIGDPTGKNKTRPIISQQEIEQNTLKFIEQAKMILRFDDPQLLEIRRNSEWYKNMSVSEILRLLSLVTHSKLISRDMFRQRIQNSQDIYMHELIYPIFQGYDSYMLNSDLTIIGSDQLFNEMLGRFFQLKFQQTPQVIITSKITKGIDGKAKQSKSLNNYIGLGHSPKEKFGRTMTLPDELIVTYFEVYTDLNMGEISEMRLDVQNDPLKYKKLLAQKIVERYHGRSSALEERHWFENVFSKKHIPEDIPCITLTTSSIHLIELVHKAMGEQETTKSTVRRLITQGAVRIDGTQIMDLQAIVTIQNDTILKIGKRNWYKFQII